MHEVNGERLHHVDAWNERHCRNAIVTSKLPCGTSLVSRSRKSLFKVALSTSVEEVHVRWVHMIRWLNAVGPAWLVFARVIVVCGPSLWLIGARRMPELEGHSSDHADTTREVRVRAFHSHHFCSSRGVCPDEIQIPPL